MVHYTSLHYTTFNFTTLHYTTLCYTTKHYVSLHYTAIHCTAQHFTSLYYTALQFIPGLNLNFLGHTGKTQDIFNRIFFLFSFFFFLTRNELAEHGFEFCTESLEAKIEKQKDLSPDAISGITGFLVGLGDMSKVFISP